MARGLACIKCRKFMRVKKCGVAIEEGMPVGEDREGEWQGYKLWMMDLHECPSCGFQLAAGFAPQPFGEHYQDDYAKKVEMYHPIARIDDCSGAKP